MKEKYAVKVEAASAAHLAEGEQVQVTTFGQVGSIKRGREMAKLAGMMAVTGVATGGLVAVGTHKKPRPMFIAGTDRQILFFANSATGSPAALVASVPLATVEVSGQQKMSLGRFVLTLAVAGMADDLKITVGSKNREETEKLAALVSSA